MSHPTVDDVFVTHLRDAHALERLMDTALGALIATAGAPELREPLEHHRSLTRRHIIALEERLAAHADRPSAVKDAGLATAAIGEALLAGARGDHAGKHARDAYVLIHLAVAGYEMLGHLARRAGDEETARLVAEHLADERASAAAIDARWDLVLDLSLRHAGVLSAPPVGPPRSLRGIAGGDG
ncbi:ferritin-like domain-containing protein [Streptomyces sp. C36]|uniref:ferritin-like domain-containing protein n=1 Tax=Streptomyces sp. C36 TaxID=3237122 RepID=UPI0034C5F9F0